MGKIPLVTPEKRLCHPWKCVYVPIIYIYEPFKAQVRQIKQVWDDKGCLSMYQNKIERFTN